MRKQRPAVPAWWSGRSGHRPVIEGLEVRSLLTGLISGTSGMAAAAGQIEAADVSAVTITAQGDTIYSVPANQNVRMDIGWFVTNPPSAELPPSAYTASIDWGDGSTPTSASIVNHSNLWTPDATELGDDAVAGAHDYAQPGTYTASFTILGPGGATGQATAMVQVTPAVPGSPPFTTAHGISFNATAFLTDSNQTMAYFPAAGPNDSASNYRARIDWGDGTGSDGTVSAVIDTGVGTGSGAGSAGGQFLVSGEHAYMAAGTYEVTVTITNAQGAQASAISTAFVTSSSNPPPAEGNSFSATTNLAQKQLVGSFWPAGANDSASNDAATIDWGDGTTSGGTVGTVSTPIYGPGPVQVNSAEQFLVSGSHAYATAGNYTVTVKLTNQDGAVQTATSTATVSDYTFNAYPAPVSVSINDPSAALNVAEATSTIANVPLSDFTATIDWGDGSTPTAGTIVPAAVPNIVEEGPGAPPPEEAAYGVTGQHSYSSPGTYTITVTITNIALGGQETVTTTAKVTATPPQAATPAPAPTPVISVPAPVTMTPAPALTPPPTSTPTPMPTPTPVVSVPPTITAPPAPADPSATAGTDPAANEPVVLGMQFPTAVVLGKSHPGKAAKHKHGAPKEKPITPAPASAGHHALAAARQQHETAGASRHWALRGV